MNLYPIGTFSLGSKHLNSILLFFIYLAIVLAQKVVWISLLICIASSTVLGKSIPNICVILISLGLVLAALIIHCLFFRYVGIYQEMVCSFSIPLFIAKSTTFNVQEALRFAKDSQEILPSFHRMQNSQHTVVHFGWMFPFLTLTHIHYLVIALLFLW